MRGKNNGGISLTFATVHSDVVMMQYSGEGGSVMVAVAIIMFVVVE